MMQEEKCRGFYEEIKGSILSELKNLDVKKITLMNDGSLWAETSLWGEYRLGYLQVPYIDKVIKAAQIFPRQTKNIDEDYDMGFTIPAFEGLPAMVFMMNTSKHSASLFTLKRKTTCQQNRYKKTIFVTQSLNDFITSSEMSF